MSDLKVPKRECVVHVDPKSSVYEEAKALADVKTRREARDAGGSSWLAGPLMKRVAEEVAVLATDGELVELKGEEARFITQQAERAARELGPDEANKQQALVLKSAGCSD